MAGSDWYRRTQRDQAASSAEIAEKGVFVQIAIVYKGKQITIYRNGELYSQYETNGAPLQFGVGGLVVIGRHVFDPASKHFEGKVDDVRIYDVALSSPQISALKADEPSNPEPWAWWSFDKATPGERTGRFETLTFGEPRVVDGKLILDGKDDAMIGVRGGAEPGPITDPPPPEEYANVFSVGYGEGIRLPTEVVEFEELILNMKNGGYNTVMCVYTDERLEICRKHGVKMMIDTLAWKEGAEMDVRRPTQQSRVLKICEKLRGDDAVWGYTLWHERLDRFAPGNVGSMNGLVLVLRKWDPTHPVWVGTYLNFLAGNIAYNPGCIAYYDYHWERGAAWHFKLLPFWKALMADKNAYLGRWMRNHDYNRSSYTMNTSIAFGLKTGIWFICGPWHPARPKWNSDYFLCEIGRDHQRLWPEIGKIGRPLEVYSTPTTKSHVNTDKEQGIPVGKAIPKDFKLQVRSGEILLGHFNYDRRHDAFYVANHNALADQKIVFEIQPRASSTVELFDRKTGQWNAVKLRKGAFDLDLRAAGGELLRMTRQ